MPELASSPHPGEDVDHELRFGTRSTIHGYEPCSSGEVATELYARGQNAQHLRVLARHALPRTTAGFWMAEDNLMEKVKSV
jgi:hypothetical protein